MFGSSNDKDQGTNGPTRIILRDALMCKADQRRFREGRLPMEEKFEIQMNRLTGTVENSMLRNMERVPAGVRFEFTLSLKRFDGDDQKFLDYALRGIRLIELDGIGGSVSRGSGQVRFQKIRIDEEDATDQLRSLEIWGKGDAA